MQQFKYFSTAWNDIKNSPGWKGKIALLALLQLVPIFGQIVLFGYLYGWARDIAWGVHAPMPAKIFGNEDGKLYSRGFFIFVIFFVLSLIPSVVTSIPSAFIGLGSMGSDGSPGMVAASFSGMFGLVSLALSLAIVIVFNIASMRTAIYDRISAGFQIDKLWAMFKHDSNGALRIFGMEILVGIIGGLIIGIVAVIIFSIAGVALIPSIMQLRAEPAPHEVLAVLGPGLTVLFFFGLIFGFIGALFTVFLHALVARASGYWTQQFQVAQWRGQDDPMPFEAEAAARAAQQAQYAAQAEYAQAQAQYAQAQGQQINYAHQQAQAAYAQAQQESTQGVPVQQPVPQAAEAVQQVPESAQVAPVVQPVSETAEPMQPAPEPALQQPVVSETSVAPETPAAPATPEAPSAPETPVVPQAPEVPEAPADPAPNADSANISGQSD